MESVTVISSVIFKSVVDMTRAELIEILATKQPHIQVRLIESAVKEIFDEMSAALENGKRIELRGFGSFALRHRPERKARNPKTGEYVFTQDKHSLHFKMGKELKERVNEGLFLKQDAT